MSNSTSYYTNDVSSASVLTVSRTGSTMRPTTYWPSSSVNKNTRAYEPPPRLMEHSNGMTSENEQSCRAITVSWGWLLSMNCEND